MTLEEARKWLTSRASGDRRHDDIGHAGYVDLYESADEQSGVQLLEAMVALLLDGDQSDQLLASGFFARVGAPVNVLRELADAYVSRNLDGRHPLADVLGLLTYQLPAEVVAILQRPFNADPVRQFGLGYAVLRHDRQGPAWESFVRAIPSIDGPDDLVRGYHAAYAARRVDDYFSALRRKSEEVVRRTARGLTGPARLELLTVCGYAFDPRPTPPSPDAPIPAEELLQLLQARRCSLWWMLPYPFQYPEDQDRSIFYRGAPRSLASVLLGRKPGEGRFFDVWYRRHPPEVVELESYAPAQFRDHFGGQWGEAKLVPLGYIEPYARVPRFVLARADGELRG